MRSIRLPIPLLAAAALIALPSLAAAAQGTAQTAPPPTPPPAQTAPGFVGAEICVTCHTQEAERLAGTPHGKGKFASLSVHGCETCHGPGSAHVNDPENKALQPRIERLSASEQTAVCQK